jgi:hypothetical protein
MTQNEILGIVNAVVNIITIVVVAWSRIDRNARLDRIERGVNGNGGHDKPPDF